MGGSGGQQRGCSEVAIVGSWEEVEGRKDAHEIFFLL
jgi:hypothetical protein